jgi:signal transduction histidine kinase
VPLTNDLGGTFKRMDDQMKLEQREKNFNVLSRIVQGVNYTLDLDDIYELIYAQTSQVIPSDDFFIILKEENAPKLNFVFYVVQDERIHEKEKQFISLNGSLEAEVVRSGRGVIANNYHEFCRSRGFDYLSDHIKNALIAPLNSGDKTKGCLFLGRHENENPFSDDQLDLLQSIADLVAGAIEKARLLEKTEQYAHQLSLLNEIVRELSSITNINQLLKSILDYSTKLVNFEEARLLMVDQDTGDLIFQEVKGENSLPLKGSIVSNKLDWFRKIQGTKEIITLDQNTSTNPTTLSHYKNQGIVVQSLMLIPLVIKENVLGVIELINHKNDHYFSDNDKQLMQSFSAQAAITWENARLYQQTDQELAERVEELSIMQKIDRELNTSLDTDTVLRITLSWAIKFLGTDAGWIGLVDNGIINHINYVGYEKKEEQDLPETILLENIRKIDFDQKIEPGKIINNELFTFHSSTQEQVLSPIYREGELIAIMLLESPSEIHFSNNQKRFLERLSDHASIAITNSKLYDEVHKANEAKSEFVSLVAHELKNPMTSIKGYTELLTTGAAGEISETQLNFLSIIRNNTERMNALVSDLNDLTKIETGNIHLEMKPIVLDEMVDELVRSLKKQFEQKNQTFQFIVESGLPALKADPNRLSQVLINLLSNANKYTQETGQITLVAEKTNQVGEKYFDQPIAHIWVQDNGYGISEQDQKFIFQKFFRSEDQNIRAVSGTGLGLNITRSFVEMMGGSIWFESEIGKGTTFHVVVPFIDHI